MEKIITNFTNYSVTDTGIVTKLSNNMVLKQQTTKNGYRQVTLVNDLGRKVCYVHRLVAEAFLPNPDNLSDVNHKDYNKENNCVSNLEWCNHSDNLKHSYNHSNRDKNREHMRQLAAANHEKMKKTVSQYSLSGELIATYDSLREAADATGVAMQNISAVTRGERGSAGGFKWVRDDIGAIDFNQKRSRFSAVQQFDLNNNLIASFNSITEAARETGVSAKGISEVCRGRNKTAGNFKWKTIAPNG